MSGDEIIVDELSGWWAAGGLADASKTWELIQLFPRSSRERLRIRQAEMDPDVMMGKLLPDVYTQQKIYILTTLRKLGESLTPEDETFLTENTTATLRLSLKKWLQNKGFNKKNNAFS